MDTLQHIVAWMSSCWWRNMKALNVRCTPAITPDRSTKCLAHSRLCMGRSCGMAVDEDWIDKRNRCTSSIRHEGLHDFALLNVKHSVVQRPNVGRHVNSSDGQKTEPGDVVPPDNSISGRREGTNVHMCGDGNVAERWISGYFAIENRTETEPEEYRRLYTQGGTPEWRTQYTENLRLLAAHVLRTHGLCEFGLFLWSLGFAFATPLERKYVTPRRSAKS